MGVAKFTIAASLSIGLSFISVSAFGQSGRAVIFVGTDPANNNGLLTASASGVRGNARMKPYGHAATSNIRAANLVPIWMNGENNKYNGIIYSRVIPESSAKKMLYILKPNAKGLSPVPNGIPVYTTQSCGNYADSDVVWAYSKPYASCATSRLLGYLFP